jgi:hypothetical protein
VVIKVGAMVYYLTYLTSLYWENKRKGGEHEWKNGIVDVRDFIFTRR